MARRRVPIDWDDLEIALTTQMDEWASYLDLRTGKVQMVHLDPFRDEDDELSEEEVEAGLAEGYLVHIDPLPSSVEYGWMAEFAASVIDLRLQELLQVALDGRGAFGRFKRVLADHPVERARWLALRDQRLREAMQEWLADHDIEPTTQPPERKR
jgi:hypothetical protein